MDTYVAFRHCEPKTHSAVNITAPMPSPTTIFPRPDAPGAPAAELEDLAISKVSSQIFHLISLMF